MTQDVRQWLAEIKLLQQKLVEAHQERDEAYASASKWRSLYETEAKQRRTAASLAQQTIDALKAEIDRLQSSPLMSDPTTSSPQIHAEVAHLQTVSELQQRLTDALIECDRAMREANHLAQALKAEQSEHTKTRKSLTTALGDTVDLLTKERSSRNGEEVTASNGYDTAPTAEPKSPLLELPRLE